MFNTTHIAHLFKLVWNRKRSNALMIIELFAAFLVLFMVTTAIVHYYTNSRKPLGFSYQNVWNVSAIPKNSSELFFNPQATQLSAAARTAQIIQSILTSQPEIEMVSFASTGPFSFSTRTSRYREGRRFEIEEIEVTDNVDKTLNISVSEGRWFNASDDMYNGTTATVKQVVINEKTAETYFGTESPVGKFLREPGPDSRGVTQTGLRVIGVMKDFRKNGEYSISRNMLFNRVSLQDTSTLVPHQILLKMKSGVDAGYEEKLMKILQQTAPDWSFQISTLEHGHDNVLKAYLIPLGVGMIVAVFLLTTIALGLVGVVWQSVMRRMRELGVRRAFGATQRDIHVFVLGEIAVLTTFSVILGGIVLAQLPLMPIFEYVTPNVYAAGVVISILGMYLGTVVCALYPSRIAAVVQPSEALRYE